MSKPSVHEILVVDDDHAVRMSLEMLLAASGYSVRTAEHGLDALFQLRQKQAAIVISDLNMPQMSGFELLSVVRRRFPQVAVIAMSGDYESADDLPSSVPADAFYPKGRSHPSMLLATVAGVVRTSNHRNLIHQKAAAPLWIRCSGRDVNGASYVMLTCTECLRSFPLSTGSEERHKIQETPCIFCSSGIRFVMDHSFLGMPSAPVPSLPMNTDDEVKNSMSEPNQIESHRLCSC